VKIQAFRMNPIVLCSIDISTRNIKFHEERGYLLAISCGNRGAGNACRDPPAATVGKSRNS
jgi:hypothetical protein